ncbi:lasso RiPP family leader peptide-containing protein [Actinocorallia sp. API 0066]|uniref:lasso RiPP family leader peptide-containing protein n=1 Tax=Actinocorallia sp. API 0066 TaxID=2896846 RepID=UPI001E55DD10|nr:lasso RiPP family leader peptide-containing protein [Actinocorallia sp. API 0066]MCD0449561.1 lasso RiPP family leader peptide-containing protein [Actinocorallia sp. API 0066]
MQPRTDGPVPVDAVYEPPLLTEVGGFTRLTLGGGYLGLDNFWQTDWYARR